MSILSIILKQLAAYKFSLQQALTGKHYTVILIMEQSQLIITMLSAQLNHLRLAGRIGCSVVIAEGLELGLLFIV